VVCKKQILPHYLLNLFHDGDPFTGTNLEELSIFFTGTLFYSVTSIFLNSDHSVRLHAPSFLPLFQFAISHGPAILAQFIAVNIVTVVCSFSFFAPHFGLTRCAHIF
jgi:hypothetical protein